MFNGKLERSFIAIPSTFPFKKLNNWKYYSMYIFKEIPSDFESKEL